MDRQSISIQNPSMMKIICSILVVVLLGNSSAQYQYSGASVGTSRPYGATPASTGSAGAVDNRILGLNNLLGGGGVGGAGSGGIGGLFGNILGNILGGGSNARPSFGQTYPAVPMAVPSYGGGAPVGYGGYGGYSGALGTGYAGTVYPGGIYPGNNFGGGYGPGYGAGFGNNFYG